MREVSPFKHSVGIKVIIHKSRGEVSLVEQDTTEYVSQPIKIHSYFFKIVFFIFLTFILCNLLVRTLQYLKKKCLWKQEQLLSIVAHNRPIFFQYCQLAQKQPKSQIFFIEISHCVTSLQRLWQALRNKTENDKSSHLNDLTVGR